jgi:toxin ParE1/3/4
LKDLDGLYLYGILNHGLHQAEAYQDQLEHSFAVIADNPGMARERTEVTPPARARGSHMIIDDKGMLIVGVRHHREEWANDPVTGQ